MRSPVVRAAAFGLVACAMIACHGTTSFVSGEGLATLTSGSPEKSPCNDLPQQGTPVDLVGSSKTPPAPAGGTIQDGTYVLTSSVLHTKDKSDGAKLVTMGRITMVVKGTTAQLVRTGADGRERRTTVNRVSSGSVTTSRTTCASPTSTDGPDPTTTQYSANGTSLQFITPGPAGVVVATYTKL